MKALRSLFPNTSKGNPLVVLGLVICLLVGAYHTANLILEDDIAGLAYIGLACLVGVFVIAMLNSWRTGLYLFLGWLLFEDLARKYLGNNMAVYFGKDLLVFVVFLSFFLAWRRREVPGFRPPFGAPLLLLVWFGFLQVFNPASPHLVYGVLGMKLFFYYMPLMFVGYALLDSELELRKFFFANLGVIALIASLGIVQSIVGPQFLNPGQMQEDIRELSNLYRVAPISGAIVYRPTSVFVSTGRYADLLDIGWLLVLGFSGYMLLRHRKGRWFVFLSLTITAAGAVLCASRGVFAWALINVVVTTVAFLWGAPWREGETIRVLRGMQRVALGIGLAVVLLLSTFPDALLGRLAVYSETLSPDSSQSELMHRSRDYPIRNFLAAFEYDRWPYGYGIGTTALGTQYVARIFHTRPPVSGVESGFGSLIIEMGIVGLILWLIMSTAVVFSAWKVVRELRGSPWFPIGFVIFWYAFLLLFPFTFGGIQPYEDFVLNAYLWLLLGILFRLPSLKASAEFAAAASAGAQPQRRWAV